MTVTAGSIILAPGYEPFDPATQSQYGYGRFSNVVTSLEFERLISASGPHGGDLLRPSDGAVPHRIAWLQCVGSRDESSGCSYCSAVCCMYATKQVILSKEHHPEIEAVVLHNDIRAFGKGFERFYDRARHMPGVRYAWAKASVVTQRPETGSVVLRYRADSTGVQDEEFDLVVLSVGLHAPPGNRELAVGLSLEMNRHGFCASPPFSPMETSRKGIFACGVFHAPMDIPDTVTMASGAAALASRLLADTRGTMVREKTYPPERDVAGEPPRIGLFVCHCGTNIAKVVDVARVVQYAEGLPHVAHAAAETFACSVDAVGHMTETIREKGLNRVVVAACTPRTHEPVFQEALREAGLNPYLFEFANIREHCSLVHMTEKERATQKAQDLVRIAATRAALLEPLYRVSYKVVRSALVIGGGVAGMRAALSLAQQGIEVHLVEKNTSLGGLSLTIPATLEGADIRGFVTGLIADVEGNELIHVATGAQVVEHAGYVGNFTSVIDTGSAASAMEVRHGVTIVATGAEELKPWAAYLYGEDDRVKTLLELDAIIDSEAARVRQWSCAVFIQCVGSRDEKRPYCSRVCCSHSVANALKLKSLKPEMDVYVLYRDMRTYGFKEDYYKKASDAGVIFIRYDTDDPPDIRAAEEEGRAFLRLTAAEPVLGERIEIDADMVCLASAAIPPEGNRGLSQLLKVPLNEDGFFMEAHMKLRPVDFATDGIFMCGTAHSPKLIDESIAQAEAAASRAMSVLAREELTAGGPVARVAAARCSGCGVCWGICPYQAVSRTDDGLAVVNEALCKGCGTCVSSCRSGAMDIRGISDEQTWAAIQALYADEG
jgi:heterodisulfide reductase subunit A